MSRLIRYLCSIVLTLTVTFPAFSSAGDWNINELMMKLAGVKQAELAFTETRSSIFLTDTISTSGSLIYRAPDFIEKRITDPYSELIRVSGDQIIVEQVNAKGNNKKRVFTLSDHDALNTTVQGIRATLAGNINLLQEHYSLELVGDEFAWELHLKPINLKSQELVEQINLMGMQERINQIQTVEPNGDESRLTLVYKSLQ